MCWNVIAGQVQSSSHDLAWLLKRSCKVLRKGLPMGVGQEEELGARTKINSAVWALPQ